MPSRHSSRLLTIHDSNQGKFEKKKMPARQDGVDSLTLWALWVTFISFFNWVKTLDKCVV